MKKAYMIKNLQGQLHCETGPAYESESCKEWHINGKLHREDGSATIYKNNKIIDFCINGKYIT